MKKHEKKHMPDTTEYGPPLFDVDRFRIRFYTALLVLGGQRCLTE